jgi:hypothetical protein
VIVRALAVLIALWFAFTPAEARKAGQEFFTEDGALLLSGPSDDSRAIRTLRGEIVWALRVRRDAELHDGWVKVLTPDGQKGWVRRSDLSYRCILP